jgi:hypothetical protein
MSQIVVTELRPADRERWNELWRGYLDFYETRLPDAIYDHTWARLMAPDGAMRGFGARRGDAAAPLIGITHYLFHDHAGRRNRCAICRICSSMRALAGPAAAGR